MRGKERKERTEQRTENRAEKRKNRKRRKESKKQREPFSPVPCHYKNVIVFLPHAHAPVGVILPNWRFDSPHYPIACKYNSKTNPQTQLPHYLPEEKTMQTISKKWIDKQF